MNIETKDLMKLVEKWSETQRKSWNEGSKRDIGQLQYNNGFIDAFISVTELVIQKSDDIKTVNDAKEMKKVMMEEKEYYEETFVMYS